MKIKRRRSIRVGLVPTQSSPLDRKTTRAVLCGVAPAARHGIFGLPVLAVGLGMAGAAHAQLLDTYFPRDLPGNDVAKGVTVQSRSRPDYDFDGTRVGDVVIRPQVAESIGYNDNVLGRSNGPGSAITKTEASVQAVTDWSRDSLGFFIGTEDHRYLDLPDQNETNWRASLGGTLDVGRDVAAVTYKHISQHQDPGDIDSANFDKPLAYDVDDVRASYRIQFSRLSLTPAVEFFAYRFSPGSLFGVPVEQKSRDRNTVQEELTARYEVTPQDGLLAVVRPVQTHYVTTVSGVRQPSSTGVSVLGGIDYLGDGSVRYRALVGYETRSYANTIASHSAPIAEASGSWSPTGLTSFTATVSRSIEDAGDEDSVGYTFTQAKLAVDHEYRRNVLLNGYVGVQDAAYLQNNRDETHYQAGVGATWLLNHYMRLAATYDFVDSNTSGGLPSTFANPSGISTTSPSYTRNTVLLRLEFGRFDPSDR